MNELEKTAIGVLASSAIGSILTQTMLDTFHHAGIGDELVTSGIDRIEEILNNSSTLSKTSFVVKDTSDNLAHLVYVSIKHIAAGEVMNINLSECWWIDRWIEFYGRLEYDADSIIFSIPISIEKMIQYNVSIETFKQMDKLHPIAISPLFQSGDCFICELLFCIPYKQDEIDNLVVDILPAETSDVDKLMYVSYKLYKQIIMNARLKGVKNIGKVIIQGDRSIIIGNPNASMFDVLHVDPKNIICNKIKEMYQIFGIEVAKRCMLEELKSIMPQILPCHIRIIVDKMTWSGIITSVTRYTSRTDPDPLKRISFEEAARNINSACTNSEVDLLVSISSKLVVSKKI